MKKLFWTLGIILVFAVVFFALANGGEELKSKTYNMSDEFSDIKINTECTDVSLVKSDGSVVRVDLLERDTARHTVEVKEGVLCIDSTDERKWYEKLFDFGKNPTVTVYLPELSYGALEVNGKTGDVSIADEFEFLNVEIGVSTGDVECYSSAIWHMNISLSTGDVLVSGARADSIEISLSTGDIELFDVECDTLFDARVSTGEINVDGLFCESIKTEGSTGDLTLKNVITTGSVSIKRSTGDTEIIDSVFGSLILSASTGDIHFERFDASEITVETSTGDVYGSILTEKVFIYKTRTGNVSLPESIIGGKCKITTTTGDIKIKIAE